MFGFANLVREGKKKIKNQSLIISHYCYYYGCNEHVMNKCMNQYIQYVSVMLSKLTKRDIKRQTFGKTGDWEL